MCCFLYNMWIESFDHTPDPDSADAGAAGSSSDLLSRRGNLNSEQVRSKCEMVPTLTAVPHFLQLATKMKVPQQTNSTDCGLYTCQYIRQFAETLHKRRSEKKSTVITLDTVQNRKNEWIGPRFFEKLSGSAELGIRFRHELLRFVNLAEEEYLAALKDEKERKKKAKKAKAAKIAESEKDGDVNSDSEGDEVSGQRSGGDSEEDSALSNHDSLSATESEASDEDIVVDIIGKGSANDNVSRSQGE